MAITEHYTPSHPASCVSAIQTMAARITARVRAHRDSRRTAKAVRYLSDHIKRDIGWIGPEEKSPDQYSEFTRINSIYAW